MSRRISSLGKTWIFDLDGTVVKHNGYKLDGHDTLLEGAKEFFDALPKGDMVIFVTARLSEYKELTEDFLNKSGISHDAIIYGVPFGERILINDTKPSGLETAIAINTKRDKFMMEEFIIDEQL